MVCMVRSMRSSRLVQAVCVLQQRARSMRPSLAMGLIVLVAATGGCVSESQYRAAVAETEEVKAELDRAQTQMSALDQQAKSIQERMGKLTAEAAAASAEVQELQASRDTERERIEDTVQKLEQEFEKLSGQHKKLRHELAAVEKENASLKAAVVRYQKELKDRAQAASSAKPVESMPASRAVPGMGGALPQDAQAAPPSAKPAPAPNAATLGATTAKSQEAKAAQKAAKEPSAAQENAGVLARIKQWIANLLRWIL